MDHDAMLKDVQGLKKFRDRVEAAIAFIEGLRAAGYTPPGSPIESTEIDARAKGLQQDVDALGEAVAALQLAKDQPVVLPVAVEARLAALEGSKAEAEEFSDRLNNMLTWFDANQAGIEVLLTLDGDPDTAAGGPIPDAGVAAGASASVSGTDTAAGAGQASQAPPQGQSA